MSEQGDGRDYNPYGFTMWFAGGGVNGPQTIGSTDEVGLYAVEDRLHVHDLHATVLVSHGVDSMELVYKHKGRPERATLYEGNVHKKLFGSLAGFSRARFPGESHASAHRTLVIGS
jgi:hypothetical protein